MKKTAGGIATLLLLFSLMATGCGSQAESNEQNQTNGKSEAAAPSSSAPASKTITYLGKEYQVPEKPQKIAVLSVEGLEEMHILGVKPYAAAKDMYVNGIPEEIGDTLNDVQWIESGFQPDKEQLLKLKPDLILGSARMDAEALKPIQEIAPTIPLSFSGNDSEANIMVVGEVTGKVEEAKKAIEDYKQQLQASKEKIGAALQGKNVMYLRISTQYGLGAYSKDTTYNQVLYGGLGLEVPGLIEPIKRREEIPLEKLAQANPDYIFALVPINDMKAMDELKKKPLWNQINAVKDGHVFVNPVHPDLFGAPLLSKKLFVEQVTSSITNAK
ncbi:ABC transporter substrate-binding protein [Brevibacillus centrosporus]|uniref:ABC transporter substrate-binding protein n=1 Tax=Brevibacillus centrosporus TaxID=54910 RepID=UPI002E1FF80B|nr:ABC transporter substrate-binding protein [Brevibacillus centrosporus]